MGEIVAMSLVGITDDGTATYIFSVAHMRQFCLLAKPYNEKVNFTTEPKISPIDIASIQLLYSCFRERLTYINGSSTKQMAVLNHV